jgi:hypothetical protein
MPIWPEDLLRQVINAFSTSHEDRYSEHSRINHDVLRKCALVSRVFYTAARVHTFRRVYIGSLDRCVCLLNLISCSDNSSRLGIYIREVDVSWISNDSNPFRPSWDVVQQLASSLTSLELLILRDQSLGDPAVMELTSSHHRSAHVPRLQLTRCNGLTWQGVARLLEQFIPSCLEVACAVHDGDASPPSWMANSYIQRPGSINLQELDLSLKHTPGQDAAKGAPPAWFTERGYARSVKTLTLRLGIPVAFLSGWALVQQAAGAVEQLSIKAPSGVSDLTTQSDFALAPITASSLTSLRIEGICMGARIGDISSSFDWAMLILQGIYPRAPLLRKLDIQVTFEHTDVEVVQIDNGPWSRLDGLIAGVYANKGTPQSQDIIIGVVQRTSNGKLASGVHPAGKLIQSYMPFTDFHRSLTVKASWARTMKAVPPTVCRLRR